MKRSGKPIGMLEDFGGQVGVGSLCVLEPCGPGGCEKGLTEARE